MADSINNRQINHMKKEFPFRYFKIPKLKFSMSKLASQLLVNFKNFFLNLRPLTQLIHQAHFVCEIHSPFFLSLHSLLEEKSRESQSKMINPIIEGSPGFSGNIRKRPNLEYQKSFLKEEVRDRDGFICKLTRCILKNLLIC